MIETTRKEISYSDTRNIIILMAAAFLIGAYVVSNTTLIAEDGNVYIRTAQEIHSGRLIYTIEGAVPAGYAYCIAAVYPLVSALSTLEGTMCWIVSGQVTSLLFYVLSIVPLYLTGKRLFNSQQSFFAILILIFLPYSVHNACDCLRDWPGLFFMISGLYFLIAAFEKGSMIYFFTAGFASVVGSFIRPECTQAALYGLIILVYKMFKSKDRSKLLKLLADSASLVFCHAVLIIFLLSNYMVTKQIMPENGVLNISPTQSMPECFINLFIGAGKLVEDIAKMNSYIFFLPAIIGIIHFIKNKDKSSMPVMLLFFIINITVYMTVFSFRGRNSERHLLPLLVISVIFIPPGIEILIKHFTHNPKKVKQLFCVFLTAGILIGLPRLIDPIRSSKSSYRNISKWLNENTEPDSTVVTFDMRIPLYADREGIFHKTKKLDKEADYAVQIFKTGQEEMINTPLRIKIEEVYRYEDQKNNSTLVIYEANTVKIRNRRERQKLDSLD